MRAASIAALIVLFAAAVTMEQAMPHQRAAERRSTLLLAQNVTNLQAGTATPRAPAQKSRAQNSNTDGKQKADGKAQSPENSSPGTMPWLGAPPQFQRTWPPT